MASKIPENKEMKLEDYKKKDPFATPEGYFEKLNSDILKATCGSSLPQEKRKKVSLVSRMRWVGYAAMIAIIATVAAGITSIPGADRKKGISPSEFTAGNTSEYDNSIDGEYIDNMLESYPIDEYTFYCYLTDTDNN